MTSLDALNPDFRDLLRALCETQKHFEPQGYGGVDRRRAAVDRPEVLARAHARQAWPGLLALRRAQRNGAAKPVHPPGVAHPQLRAPRNQGPWLLAGTATSARYCRRLWRSAAIARLGRAAAAWTRGAAAVAGEPPQGG